MHKIDQFSGSKTLTANAKWIAASFLIALHIFLVSPSPAMDTSATLKNAVHNRFLIGAAVMSHTLDIPEEAALLSRQFNCLTSENDLKPQHIHPEPDKFNFAPGDRLVAFAREHNMKMTGHCLLWHQALPQWMFEDAAKKPLPREKALENLRLHIKTVLGHFRGSPIIGWDVVNEALSDKKEEYLRSTPALRAIGDDYLAEAFAAARDADPNMALYYNDYNIEQPVKRAKAIRLIRSLKEKGLRVDAIGIQGHWSLRGPNLKDLEDSIKEFAAEGVKVMITELDVDVLPSSRQTADVSYSEGKQSKNDPYTAGCPDDVLNKQAKQYSEIFQVFMRHTDAITRVTFWNLTDRSSWLNFFPVKGRTNYPLLFDRQCQPKPAFFSVIRVLSTPNNPGAAGTK